MTVIVDYGVGNLFSLKSSLAVIGEESVISADSAVIERADRVILPGVGAFRDAMEKLRASGLVDTLRKVAEQGKPLLGICLGM
ncbi:MAG: imidazole glycerol phosphate synthase subunit HisH, partial [Clostridia bacterium]|nr:imidazole glycerol phosphate synthase subunit HisH [Clostridia bacterium]